MSEIVNAIIGFICVVLYFCSQKFKMPDWYIPLSYVPLVLIPILSNRKNICFSIQILFHYNKPIRISMAYIYRICIDGKYLLVQNSHRPNSYQFVGGKYKYYDQAVSDLQKLDMQPDDKLGQGSNRKNDIAFYIPARKLKSFINWFESQINRDIDCTREFREELFAS